MAGCGFTLMPSDNLGRVVPDETNPTYSLIHGDTCFECIGYRHAHGGVKPLAYVRIGS